MKNRINDLKLSLLLVMFIIINSCTKDGLGPSQNSLLKKVIMDGYVESQYNYNQDNLLVEVNSTLFYRKFHYDNSNNLIKEEIATSPDRYSSSMPMSRTHEFVNPDITGISMYSIYEYNENGNLSKQFNYIPSSEQDELRSIRTFEYDHNSRIAKVLLHDSKDAVTQFLTYLYDDNGNVKEENYYSYLYVPASEASPKHLYTMTYEYDKYFNPYVIFKPKGYPGINSNLNNIIKVTTKYYDNVPGRANYSVTTTSYKYNKSGYPIKVEGAEEFIY